jgi:hypothetical protein
VRFYLQTYLPRFLRLPADIGSEPMFAALRAHFQEWRMFKKARHMSSDTQPRRTSGTGSKTAHQRLREAVSKQPEAQVSPSPKTTDARDHGSLDTSPKDYERDEVVEKPQDATVPSCRESTKTKTNTNGKVDGLI